jgi:hypothetical protein
MNKLFCDVMSDDVSVFNLSGDGDRLLASIRSSTDNIRLLIRKLKSGDYGLSGSDGSDLDDVISYTKDIDHILGGL